MLASDANNMQFMGATNPDSALHVRFYMRPLKNEWQSKQQGRPIFEDQVFVEIHTPGNNLNIIDVPAREDHKARFPLQWAHYQNTHGNEAGAVGTPIDQWPGLSPAQIEMLRAQKFYTVEMIAFASDLQIQSVGMLAGTTPFAFRDRAKLYLEGTKGNAEQGKLLDELATERKKREDLEARLARLEATVPSQPPVDNAHVAPGATPFTDAEIEANKELKLGTPEADQAMERSQLAMAYEMKFGKKPHHKLGLERLREEVAA